MDKLDRDARDVGPLPQWDALVLRWLLRQRELIERELGRRGSLPSGRRPEVLLADRAQRACRARHSGSDYER
jgi:hypothetical protein